jgi:UDP-N-acetylglucosamine 3-dehydrogenase
MKIAVIGTGSMGKNHVRVLKNIPEVNEIIISDINRKILEDTSKRFGISKSYQNHLEMLEKEKLDGVIVATPPDSHKKNVLDVIKYETNVLVEKPIAYTIEDAEEMIKAAEKKGVIFTVGHIERFNPVVTKIKDFIDDDLLSNIYLLNTRRVGPFPKRLLGKVEGVLIDLAVHDFDIINYLGGKIENIQSQIIKSEGQEIYVKVLLDIENNIKGSSEFSWISPQMQRNIEIYGNEGMIFGDYYNQEVWFYENDDYDNIKKTETFFRNGLVKSGKAIKYPIYKQEPLLLELTNFIRSIKGKDKILVKPKEALITLKHALRI